MSKSRTNKEPLAPTIAGYDNLLGGISGLIATARQTAVRAVNAVMTATYWDIGRQIIEFEQGGKSRAAYGARLLEQLSVDLTVRHGRGYSVDNLERFRLLYVHFPLPEISATALRKSAAPVRLSDRESSASPKYQLTRPQEKVLAAELEKTRKQLESRT